MDDCVFGTLGGCSQGTGASVLGGSVSLEAPRHPALRARQQGHARTVTLTVLLQSRSSRK